MKPSKPFLLTREELRGYDLHGVLKTLAGFKPEAREMEIAQAVHDRAAKEGALPPSAGEGAVFVPWEVLNRDLVVGTPTAGGNLVGTTVSPDYIPALRAASRVVEAGSTVLPGLRGNLAVPRVSAGVAASWVAENAAAGESQQSVDQVALSPKTATAWVDVGRRLVLQSSPAVQKLVSDDLLGAAGQAIDAAAIAGTGASNEPRGILNTSGIGSVAGGANGAAPTWDHVVDLETAVSNTNAPAGARAYLTNSRVRGKLRKTQMFATTNGAPVWQADGDQDRLGGRRAFVSNNVPNTLVKGTSGAVCSAILFGNWNDLLIGMWGEGLTLMVDPYTNSTTGGVRIIVHVDVDVAVRYATSFAAMLDALTS